MNKRLLHLLGVFLLSDEITLVDPKTELISASDPSSNILEKLKEIANSNSTDSFVREFNYLDDRYYERLEKGFREVSEKLAAELNLLIDLKPERLNKLIRQLKKRKLLPGKLKSASLPYAPDSDKYKGKQLEELISIWKEQDRDLPWGHVYMIQQEKLNETLRKLCKKSQHNSDISLGYEFLHAYFAKARNELFSDMARSQFYAPACDRSWLFLKGQELVAEEALKKTPGSGRAVDQGSSLTFPTGVLSPSLSFMGLWAVSKEQSKGNKKPREIIEEILKESRCRDSSTDLMEKIKSFRETLWDCIHPSASIQSGTNMDELSNKYKKVQEEVDRIVKDIREDLSLNEFFKAWAKDMKEALSFSDIVTMLSALYFFNLEGLCTIAVAKTMEPFIKNIRENYHIWRPYRSILDDLHLENKVVQSLF